MAILGLFFFLFFIKISHTLQLCEDSFSPVGPEVRFPFGLDGDGCNYPGFNLSCNERGQTILNLPRSGNFIVKYIDYQIQEVHIKDPGKCFAQRLLQNFSLWGSPFIAEFHRTFSFLNCSSNFSDFVSLPPSSRTIYCLSDDNFTIVAIPFHGYVPSIPSCTVKAKMVDVPVSWSRYYEEDSSLIWSSPDCRECEQNGGNCGFKDASTLEIGCFNLPSNTNGTFSIT
ncbi:putative RING-H2 finger protein ATL21B [Hevea brasiliensis]|uniref:putative RING-H2 finger protein ATL21B n=1 Tax=Hevea brasiliensis TaxID=3981 RepID=UPI0025E6D97C|nr:putative RING-H2 finger protein ATL21B [Hevea brasiliensis]